MSVGDAARVVGREVDARPDQQAAEGAGLPEIAGLERGGTADDEDKPGRGAGGRAKPAAERAGPAGCDADICGWEVAKPPPDTAGGATPPPARALSAAG